MRSEPIHDRCPAFPATGRTIYQGYLFVGGVLLNESGMQHHPLTPMTDANLVRVLQQQTKRKVGLVDHAVVSAGASAIAERFGLLKREGCGFAIVDAISDDDLNQIAAASANLPLITGGSGLAQGLPQNFRQSRALSAPAAETRCRHRRLQGGRRRKLFDGNAKSGRRHARAAPVVSHRPFRARKWTRRCRHRAVMGRGSIGNEPILIYATAAPEDVKAHRQRWASRNPRHWSNTHSQQSPSDLWTSG